MSILISIIVVVILYYISIGTIISILGSMIMIKADMKPSKFIRFVYCILWPIFTKMVCEGIIEIIKKDTSKSVMENINKQMQSYNLNQPNGNLVGNEVTPDNFKIPEDAIPLENIEEENSTEETPKEE